MEKRKKLVVDSKQACFLCLKVKTMDIPSKTSPWSISQLCCYLKFDIPKVFDTSSVPTPTPFQTIGGNIWEETDLKVNLCKDCHSVSTKFGKLFHQLELIKQKLDATVQTIHQLISEADKDGRRVQQYRQLMTTNTPEELSSANLVQNLRKETKLKCSLRVRKELSKKNNIVAKATTSAVQGAPAMIKEGSSSHVQTKPVGGTLRNDAVLDIPLECDKNIDNKSHPTREIESSPSSIYLPLTAPPPPTTANNKGTTPPPDGSSQSEIPSKKLKEGFNCLVCGHTATTQNRLLLHYRMSKGNCQDYWSIKCEECRETFDYRRQLRHHLMKCHLSTLFKDCDFKAYPQIPPCGTKNFEACIVSRLQDSVETLGTYVKPVFSCKYCGTTLSCHSDTKFHVIEAHRHDLIAQVGGNHGGGAMSAIEDASESSLTSSVDIGAVKCELVTFGDGMIKEEFEDESVSD